jgi:hypothetical protein
MTDSPYVLVLTGPAERRFAIRLDTTPVGGDASHTRGFVVDDVDAGTVIGEAGATCQPIVVEIAGERHVLFAGTADYSDQKFTTVNGHRYPVRDGVWMSFPEPFSPGMVVEIAGLDGDGKELFHLLSAPLEPGRLTALFGPSWTTYAPGE